MIVEGRAPILFVECNSSEEEVHGPLRYLKARFPEARAWQVHALGTKDYQTPEGIRVSPALAFLRTLV